MTLSPLGLNAEEDLELEDLDAMSLLEEFNEEIEGELPEDDDEPVPEESISGLDEEEKLLLGELDEVSQEEVIFNELSEKEDEILEEQALAEEKEDLEAIEMAKEIDLDDELDDLDGETVDVQAEPVETLAEKKQKEKDLFEELQAIKQREIDEIVSEKLKKKEMRYTTAQVEALKVQLKDIAASPIMKANINKGTKVIQIDTGKKFVVTKDITVKAYSLTDANKFRYIQNKKGEIAYKVYYNQVANIKDTIDLYQRPHYFSRIEKVEKVDRNDQKFDYSLRFNLHGGVSLNQYTARIVGDTESFAPMIRTEFGVMSNFSYPAQFGLAMMYESITGSLKDGGGRFTNKILSFGPSVMFQDVYAKYDLIIQPRISVFADLAKEAKDETTTYKLSDTSLMLAMEKHTDYKMFGKFTLGYSFQRKWVKPKAQDTAFDSSSTVRFDDSFAIYVGHRSDWIW